MRTSIDRFLARATGPTRLRSELSQKTKPMIALSDKIDVASTVREEVLAIVAQERASSGHDGSPWDVLAVLADKNRDTEIAPYAVLARHGGKLLQYAIDIYLEAEKELERFDRKHLLRLFQPRDREFWTTKIREDAPSIERYPVAN